MIAFVVFFGVAIARNHELFFFEQGRIIRTSILKIESRTTLNEADWAKRPEGTRRDLPGSFWVQRWSGGNPPVSLLFR